MSTKISFTDENGKFDWMFGEINDWNDATDNYVHGLIQEIAEQAGHDEDEVKKYFDSGEYLELLQFVHLKQKPELNAVMTSSEISNEFGITPDAVRLSISRGAIIARKAGNFWLVLRKDAEKRWRKEEDLYVIDKATKGYKTPLSEVMKKCEGDSPADWSLDPINDVWWEYNPDNDNWTWYRL